MMMPKPRLTLCPSAARPSQRCMLPSSNRLQAEGGIRLNRSPRRPASPLRRSADQAGGQLAGRAMALSPEVAASFDAPLAPHHRIIGRWLGERDGASAPITRVEARALIERAFAEAVSDILSGNSLVDLSVIVLSGNDADQPPAIAIICDTVGQVALGWIEKTNALRHTMSGSVAPKTWRAAAYRALDKLRIALPMFDFDDMIEEFSMYYWDGETTDAGARRSLAMLHAVEEDELEDMILPSMVFAKRPDFMLKENARNLITLPKALRSKIERLDYAAKALSDFGRQNNAWAYDTNEVHEYLPDYEDWALLPPMTLVPFDIFSQEIDEIGRHGMEMGFFDLSGLCPLGGADTIDHWFTSLRLGAEVILAAQDLIDFDPAQARARK